MEYFALSLSDAHICTYIGFLNCSIPEPKDDDVIRNIIRLREKLGWQTVLPQHSLKYGSSKIAVQKITLKVLFYFI